MTEVFEKVGGSRGIKGGGAGVVGCANVTTGS